MDNVILDVVLGLVLTYLLMALLLTKVQEVWVGQLRAGRTYQLHEMLMQVVGNDGTLKDKVLANPSLFAMSKGHKPAGQRNGWLGTASGPSAIPPDLFTRALLAELFDDGKHNHPSGRYITPDQFVREVGGNSSARIWGTLRGLLSGNEGDWTKFESAIASWYKAVGDRADGWYQRSSQTWSFWLALALAFMLNVDTFHLAERLANEPELRRSFATLAQNVNALRVQEQAEAKGAAAKELTPPAASLAPDRRAEQALNQAAALITSTYFRNEDVAKFDVNFGRLAVGKGTEPLVTQCAGLKMDIGGITDLPEKRRDKSQVFLSNPINWVYVLPALQAQIKVQRKPAQMDKRPQALAQTDKPLQELTQTDSGGWSTVHDCIANLSAWVALTAQRPTKDSTAQDALRQAATELNRAADALLELLQDRVGQASFAQLFLADPEAFERCHADTTTGKDGLRQCVLAAQAGTVSLPFGWAESNRRRSFCRAEHLRFDQEPPQSSWLDSLCGSKVQFKGDRALQIRPMVLRGPGAFEIVAFVVGLVVTAFFVALGAPFWFDLLGRVVKLRAAGSKSREEALTSPEVTKAAPLAAPPPADGDEPFSLARTVAERALPVSELLALQGALNVERTGVWDKPTRQQMAIENQKLGLGSVDELTSGLYYALLGRALAGVTPLQPPASGLKLDVASAQCGPAATALTKALGFDGRIALLPTAMTDELRALAVLWRYKQEAAAGAAPLLQRSVKERAGLKHDLDDISPAELAQILALAPGAYPRNAQAPWLDWALGELGQTEAGPKAPSQALSNRRILEYLAAAGLPHASEDTAWCAAFVTWVLRKHNSLLPPGVAAASAPPVADPALAASFGGTWGTTIWTKASGAVWTPGNVLAGDVITFALPNGQHPGVNHVGFVLESSATGATVLSGNYFDRVGIDPFVLADIDGVHRP